MTQTVKLAQLKRSTRNVRTTPPKNIERMASSIRARGIMQNLLIKPSKPRGTFEVIAGDRRFLGASLLAKMGEIDANDYDVPVKIVTGDDRELREISTVENFEREDLTPAEECRAFQDFIETTGDIDAVAKRFNVTRRFIEGRLRLASLAEPIFEALSTGEITLDVAKAYASTENQEKQLLVWNSYQNAHVVADTIRRVIANGTLKASDPIAILVGEARYREAGGKVDGDLYTEGNDVWVHPEIAHRLAGEIMEAEAKRIGEEMGFAWIRPIASNYAHNAAHGLYRAILQQPALTEEQSARLLDIGERSSVLDAEMQDGLLSEDALKLLHQEDDRLIAEADAIENRPPVLPEELKPHVGAFLLLTPQGEMRLDAQYYSEQQILFDEPTANDESDETGGDREDGDTDESGERGERTSNRFRIIDSEPRDARHRPEAVAPGGKPLSARLYDELAMQRRDILAASLLRQPALALDYALFAMIDARSHASNPDAGTVIKYGTTIRATGPQDPMSGDLPPSRARDYLSEAHDGLDAAWTEHESELDRFEGFRALDDDSKAGWLAYIVALSLEAKPGTRNEHIPLHNRLASILDIDVASWWRPTSENFFDRVNKGSILSLLHDVGGAPLTARHASLKKDEISVSCQKLFAGDAIVEPEVKAAALAWVPNAMRFLDVVPEETLEIGGAEDDETPTSNGSVGAAEDFVGEPAA